MLTVIWSVGVGIAAIWGQWDWRVAVTGWIVTVVVDAVIIMMANADHYPEEC